MTMNRREFIKSSALAGFFAAGGCPILGLGSESGLSVAGMRIGVQMYSVNGLWKKDPAAAFRRLKAMGYDGVQSFGFYAMDWNELAKMLDGEGLRIVDMPFYMETVKGDAFNRFVEFCKRFKIDFAFEPFSNYKTAAEWRNHAQELVALGERFAAQGIRVGYHNHQNEVREKFDGKSPLDFLYEAGLPFELDVGHVKLAGDDPVMWLKRLQNRVPSIHAKPGGGDSVGGQGDANDWSAIFAAASASGAKWAIVECEKHQDSYADVEASAMFLKKIIL